MKVILKSIMVLFLISNAAFAADEEEAVKLFVKAFNERDITAMLDLAASDMRWMSISGQKISAETSNHAELKQAMLSYFNSVPSAKSKIRSLNKSGTFVYALEEASWSINGVEKSQCSMAIYEFVERKLQHVWYFPAHQCH